MIRHDPKPMIEFLNELLRVDRAAIELLIAQRVPCNEAMADHPTVQVRRRGPDGGNTLGLLGLLNGYFGVYDSGSRRGWGPITAVVDDNDAGRIREFILTLEVENGGG